MTATPPILPKHIALIGYTVRSLVPFGAALERAGFTVYWVHSLRSFTRYLLTQGQSAARILDLSDSSRFASHDPDTAAHELRQLEYAGGPRINDIILMDRHLRTKSYGFALQYLYHAARSMQALFREQRISMVASGRDTALQLLSMLVARSCYAVWAGATYMRLPNERFMLTASHYTDQILPLGHEVGASDRASAQTYLQTFRNQSLRPYVRQSSASWLNVARRLPQHLRDGWQLLKQSRHDRGNDFARYPLSRILGMYLRKKLNLLQADLLLRPDAGPGRRPYVLFGLHRQPESSVDVLGAYFSDQPYLVRTIARSLPAGYDLLVKLHISDADGWPLSFYRMLQDLPAVRLVDARADSRRLLRNAAVTVTNSGTMAYEAGLLGLPAITFSRVHFNALPTVHYCSSPVQLPTLIDQVLGAAPQPDTDSRIEEFLAHMYAQSFPGLPNRSVFDAPLQDHDLSSLVLAYERLHEYVCRTAAGSHAV